MTEKRPFTWYSYIIDIIGEDTQHEKYVISDDKLKQMIDKYGVDTIATDGDRIIDHLWMMNNHQIDIVMSYKPNFIFRDVFIIDRYNTFTKRFNYILQKILENDDDFKYAKCMIWCGQSQYANLECFVRIYYRYMAHDGKYVLLSNHVKKWISLFDMMKRQLIEKEQF